MFLVRFIAELTPPAFKIDFVPILLYIKFKRNALWSEIQDFFETVTFLAVFTSLGSFTINPYLLPPFKAEFVSLIVFKIDRLHLKGAVSWLFSTFLSQIC